MKSFSIAHQLAVVCSLLGATSLIGCGGSSSSSAPAASSSSPTASSSASPANSGSSSVADSYEPPTDTGMPGGEMGSTDINSSSDMSGYNPDTGMSQSGSSEYGMSGTGYDGGMGMPGMGMPGTGMGMYGTGMNGQPAVVDPTPSEDEDYITKAKYAFAIGKETAAEQYFIAQIMTHEEAAPELLRQVRWSPGARKLTTTMRFAVGVDLKAPSTLQDVRPIGRSQMAGNNPGGGGDSGMAMGMSSPTGQPTAGGKSFGDLTGQFGAELITAFETAWDNGDFGVAFKDIDPIIPVTRPAMNAMNAMSGMSGTGYDPGYDGGMSSPMMDSGMPGAPGAAATDAALRLKATQGKAIIPGLFYLGTGSLGDLASKAQTEGIDYLFLFDVTVKAQRGMIQNDTRLRLISVKDGESLGATSSLNNLKVDRETAMKGESDDVTKQIGNIFRKVEPLKLSELPKLEPAHAQARIKSLIAKDPKDLLQIMLETRLFNSLGLLDNEQRDAAYQLALGGSGIAFISGTIEDREAVLKPLLPSYK